MSKYYYIFTSSNKSNMTAAARQIRLQEMAIKMAKLTKNSQPYIKGEREYLSEAIVDGKADKAGVAHLAWFLFRKDLNKSQAFKQAWYLVNDRIRFNAQYKGLDLTGWKLD